MNGLVLGAGANKTVGSLEFSKTRLQALVKPTESKQIRRAGPVALARGRDKGQGNNAAVIFLKIALKKICFI